jgi:hypothetical protein
VPAPPAECGRPFGVPESLNGASSEPAEPSPDAPPQDLPGFDYALACQYLADYGWYGVMGRYGDLVGRTPMNWLAGYAMLCARASRNVAWQLAYPHYGMEYCLLLMQVGGGKSAALDKAKRAFAGHAVKVRQGVQSGQALVESLGKYIKPKATPGYFAETYRALLYEPEFTGTFDLSTLQGSTLMKELTGLYDAADDYSLMRVTHNGGEVTIQRHQLSILAAAPVNAFKDHLKERHLRSGTMSRFLTFLCAGTHKDPWADRVDVAALTAFEADLPATDFCVGDPHLPIREFYTPDAAQCYLQYWDEVQCLDEDSSPLKDWFARTQAHFHRVAANLMWAEHKTQITPEMAYAAYAACKLWIASILQFTSQNQDLPGDPNYTQQRNFCAAWVFDHIQKKRDQSRRDLQILCYKNRRIRHMWPHISAEITRQIHDKTIVESVVGKKHVLNVP